MSVNIRNPITGELTNASGGVINPKSINEMIAPIEDGTASKPYAVGEQFIMNDLLCEATQAIAQGDTMVIGTNCEESEQLSKQVKDIKDDLTKKTKTFTSAEQAGTVTGNNYLVTVDFGSEIPLDVELIYTLSSYAWAPPVIMPYGTDLHKVNIIFVGASSWNSDITVRYRV